ncbi:MAG: exonuclease SbcCD subunit D [Chloroflexi bacterium]|nr:exonuclease SbcCD subunit D [Chloroflexota bacterium]
MRLLHFADLHLGVEAYGGTDPASGLPSRLVDFLRCLDELVDCALSEGVDLVLFAGDAYKSREPSQTHQREFAKRLRRLIEGGIPVFLLIGNHDLPHAFARATSVEIFDTLGLERITVASKTGTYNIATRSGTLQIASLPWLRRSSLLSREDTRGLSLDEVSERLRQAALAQLRRHLDQLDPSLPAVLAAHISVRGARHGSEGRMMVNSEPDLLPSQLSHPALDYVALGHVHSHQEMASWPPAVYSGSLERLDFSDAGEEKGFCLVELDPGRTAGRRLAGYRFVPVAARRFVEVRVAIPPDDMNPTATVLSALASQDIEGAIVRLEIALSPGQSLRESEIRQALKAAHFVAGISREVRRERRPRLGEVSPERLAPAQALRAYLQARKVPSERAGKLLQYGDRILSEVAGTPELETGYTGHRTDEDD